MTNQQTDLKIAQRIGYEDAHIVYSDVLNKSLVCINCGVNPFEFNPLAPENTIRMMEVFRIEVRYFNDDEWEAEKYVQDPETGKFVYEYRGVAPTIPEAVYQCVEKIVEVE